MVEKNTYWSKSMGSLILTKAESKVWAVLEKRRDLRTNVSYLSQNQVAGIAGVGTTTVSRAVAEFQARGLLRKVGNARWMLSPFAIWYGGDPAMHAARKRFLALPGPKPTAFPKPAPQPAVLN